MNEKLRDWEGNDKKEDDLSAAAPDVEELHASLAVQSCRGGAQNGARDARDGDGGGDGDIARDHAGIPSSRGTGGKGRESRDRGGGQEPGLREELTEGLHGPAGVVQIGCAALPIQEVAQKTRR